MASENSGVSIALLAKELKPFSISPTIFCHKAAGSVILSVISILPMFAPFFFRHTTPLRGAGQPASGRFGVAHTTSSREETVRYSTTKTPGNALVNASAHQPAQTVRANGIDICYETFGNDNAEPLLLIMGLGAQMIHWDDAFCEQLAARGFRVIRFDNRDIGKSRHLAGGKRLTPLELLKLRFLRIPVAATYKLIDMAKDTVGLMDALGIRSAHLVGASMGGMIAQEVTLSFPHRVRSLTSIMSTTGN